MKVLLFLFVGFSFLVTIGVWNNNISFGHGLGDASMLLFLVTLNVLLFLLNNLKYKLEYRSLIDVISVIVILISIFYFTLSLTLWRGNEQPWNGHFFI